MVAERVEIKNVPLHVLELFKAKFPPGFEAPLRFRRHEDFWYVLYDDVELHEIKIPDGATAAEVEKAFESRLLTPAFFGDGKLTVEMYSQYVLLSELSFDLPVEVHLAIGKMRDGRSAVLIGLLLPMPGTEPDYVEAPLPQGFLDTFRFWCNQCMLHKLAGSDTKTPLQQYAGAFRTMSVVLCAAEFVEDLAQGL